MTEHDSEKFYEGLREKLADYGSAPPELVWEGIRQQMPAQNTQRWKRAAILLLLLLTFSAVLTTTTRYWRPATGLGQSATTKVSASTSAPHSTASATSATASEQAAIAASRPLENSAGAQSGLAGSSAEVNSSTPASGLPLAEANANPRRSLLTTSVLSKEKEEQHLLKRRAAGEVTVATGSDPKRQRRASLLAVLLPSERSNKGIRSGLRERATRRTGLRNESIRLNTSRSERRRSQQAAQQRAPSPQEQTAADGSSSSFGSASAALTNRQAEQQFSNELLQMLPVQLQLEEAEEPEVRRVKRQKQRRSRAAQWLHGWSVQVVAGSSLTHRTLGDSARQVERLERPGVGYSGQLMASYALNKRLTVSTGLGYAEYANNLKFQVKKASQETARAVDFRDVYRFVTIPLLAQYTLGGNQRWQYGTMGGGTLGLLAGTRTAQGSACNCSQTTSPPEGTYRNTSLLLTAGGFLSYQFAPGQWLTLRPQANYFLNALSDPATGRASRHPWSVGVQGGISFDLEPKK